VEKTAVNPWKWQEQFGFVQANLVTSGGKVLHLSGQVSVDDDGNVVHEGDMAAQINKALDNVETVVSQAGMSIENIVHLRIYVTDVDAALAAYASVGPRLDAVRAAQTLLGISRLAFPGLMVEIEAVAVA
jgi:enamine deaminase RidA (YjgF/YER057c/UK114 family)